MKKLSFTQRQALEFVAKKSPWTGCNVQADYGGRTTTLWSLKRRGLICLEGADWGITQAGTSELCPPGAKSITLL